MSGYKNLYVLALNCPSRSASETFLEKILHWSVVKRWTNAGIKGFPLCSRKTQRNTATSYFFMNCCALGLMGHRDSKANGKKMQTVVISAYLAILRTYAASAAKPADKNVIMWMDGSDCVCHGCIPDQTKTGVPLDQSEVVRSSNVRSRQTDIIRSRSAVTM